MPQKIKPHELATAVSQQVVIAQADGSQKIVTPIAVLGNYTLVQHGRTQFYVSNIPNDPTNQAYTYTI